jgi:molybdopterin-guanine dinucleotide biosynthesis protein B
MTRDRIPVVSFVGSSNVGKTTLIEGLIPILVTRGLKVGVIKHHLHEFQIDRPGKDTYRYKRAGAKLAMLVSPAKVALVEDIEGDLTLEQIIVRYVHKVDLLIIEGYKKEKIPKIEVFQRKEGVDRPICDADSNLIAIVTDEKIETPLPTFARHDIQGVAEFILSRIMAMTVS